MTEPEPSFSVRIGARPEQDLCEGVPDWLLEPLLDWLEKELYPWPARWVAIRQRLSLLDSADPVLAVRRELEERARESESGRWDILDAIDLVCQSDTDGDLAIPDANGEVPIAILNNLLVAGGSAYRCRKGRLERRIDDATAIAYEHVVATANDEASMLLRRAWRATYGRDPEPSRAYGDAVRAVEAVACPLLLPNDPKPTLGRVIARLRDRPDEWYLVLAGEQEAAGIEPFRVMLKLLWTAHRSRHAGGPDTRDQLLAEAEAALALAITCVQWVTSGFVKQRARG